MPLEPPRRPSTESSADETATSTATAASKSADTSFTRSEAPQRLVSAHGNLFVGVTPTASTSSTTRTHTLPKALAGQSHHFAPVSVPPPVNRGESSADVKSKAAVEEQPQQHEPAAAEPKSDWRDVREEWVPPSLRKGKSEPALRAAAPPSLAPVPAATSPEKSPASPVPTSPAVSSEADKKRLVSNQGNLFQGVSAVASSASTSTVPNWRRQQQEAAAAKAAAAAAAAAASAPVAAPTTSTGRNFSISSKSTPTLNTIATPAPAPAPAAEPEPDPNSLEARMAAFGTLSRKLDVAATHESLPPHLACLPIFALTF